MRCDPKGLELTDSTVLFLCHHISSLKNQCLESEAESTSSVWTPMFSELLTHLSEFRFSHHKPPSCSPELFLGHNFMRWKSEGVVAPEWQGKSDPTFRVHCSSNCTNWSWATLPPESEAVTHTTSLEDAMKRNLQFREKAPSLSQENLHFLFLKNVGFCQAQNSQLCPSPPCDVPAIAKKSRVSQETSVLCCPSGAGCY